VGAGVLAHGGFEIPGKLWVPLRPDGSALVNYVGPPDSRNSFRRYSIYDVAQAADRPDPAFKDKIVLIGMTYAGSNELSYVPFLDGFTGERSCFGDEIQANEVHTLLSGRPLRESGPTAI
ncbi:MAG: CHASE2 domain-containing protein, partial [Armatimonadota bacterium]|nr:CHASE2 domain-containing protein [Armatimonadota bacterium]